VKYLRTFVRQFCAEIEDDASNPLYFAADVYVGYRFADAQMFQDGAGEGEAEPGCGAACGVYGRFRGSTGCEKKAHSGFEFDCGGAGLKPFFILKQLMARLKSCPFAHLLPSWSFSAACKARRRLWELCGVETPASLRIGMRRENEILAQTPSAYQLVRLLVVVEEAEDVVFGKRSAFEEVELDGKARPAIRRPTA